MSKYKIAISGSYGGMNLGDEAILEVIISEIKAHLDAEIVVFSRFPQDTIKRHKVNALPIREMHKDEVIKELRTLDLLIFGGGGILFEEYVEIFLREVIWAQELNIPVMVYAISVGPIEKPESKLLIEKTLNKADLITVRENEAKKILNNIGVNIDIEVTADPALLLQPASFTIEMLEKQGLAMEEPIVGFSIREPGPAFRNVNEDIYHAILANAADFIVERFKAQILFIPMEKQEHKDLQHSHAVISRMVNAQKTQVLKGEFTPAEILGLMGLMKFAVGMRLHFLIFAAMQKIPFVPLPYASKIKGFIDDLEMSMPPLEKINSGKLCAFLDRYWDNQKTAIDKIDKKMPELKARARKNTEILVNFLSKIK